jgi:hypothetical protein
VHVRLGRRCPRCGTRGGHSWAALDKSGSTPGSMPESGERGKGGQDSGAKKGGIVTVRDHP